ncbi:hypothetical protein [Micromonospora sp. NPDC093277]|uniref:hypothetical protein n=1 Tax=Micromonospora sp. NPDC093277 TaxID=3364291 RepID=UPI0037FFEBDC
MRRRDVVWWALVGATMSAWLVIGVWVHLGGEPSHLFLALMLAWGVALSAARHIFRVPAIWPKRSPHDVRR